MGLSLCKTYLTCGRKSPASKTTATKYIIYGVYNENINAATKQTARIMFGFFWLISLEPSQIIRLSQNGYIISGEPFVETKSIATEKSDIIAVIKAMTFLKCLFRRIMMNTPVAIAKRIVGNLILKKFKPNIFKNKCWTA